MKTGKLVVAATMLPSVFRDAHLLKPATPRPLESFQTARPVLNELRRPSETITSQLAAV